jgi:hypothetical protein
VIAFANIGATGLYLLFAWLLSAAIGAWVSERKGYGERLGLTFGMLLTAAGLLIVLLLPGRPGSAWKEEGWLPPRGGRKPAVAPVDAPVLDVPPRSSEPGLDSSDEPD